MLFAGEYQTQRRMARKLEVVPLPDLTGKTLLDVGCDHGFWSFLAAERGAVDVLGLDRNRPVNGRTVDLIALNKSRHVPHTRFEHVELGRQWPDVGRFDVVLLLSLYHHVYNLTGDHHPIWYWLWRCTNDVLLWENPVDLSDGVAAKDIAADKHAGYTEERIRAAAETYFDVEVIGVGHVQTRTVWRCTPKALPRETHDASVRSGKGGAAKAFTHADGRRIAEIEAAIGLRCAPGTLNLNLHTSFDWDSGYLPASVLELADRKDETSAWLPRRCRFYPIDVNGVPAYAMRFENDKYRDTFLEVTAQDNLRAKLGLQNFDRVTVTCR